MSCPCGHRYQAIKSLSTHDDGVETCPKCGGKPERELSIGAIQAHGYDYLGADPLEKQMLREQNQYITENAEKVLSGEVEIREPKGMPSFLRPQVPAPLKKTYA